MGRKNFTYLLLMKHIYNIKDKNIEYKIMEKAMQS